VRIAGDRYILYEYGTASDELDFDRRFRIHAFETKLLSLGVAGLCETAPGVASGTPIFLTELTLFMLENVFLRLKLKTAFFDEKYVLKQKSLTKNCKIDRWSREECGTWRSRQGLSNEYLIAKSCFNTAANGPRGKFDLGDLIGELGVAGLCATAPGVASPPILRGKFPH